MAALPLFEQRSRQRASIVLISDGADTASDARVRDVKSALLRSDAFVYTIAIDPPSDTRPINARVNPYALREITDDSGGRTEVVHDSADLGAATARIADELNHQYVLAYTSVRAPDGQYHSIRVRVTPPRPPRPRAARLRRNALASRLGDSLAFGRRCIPPGGVARHSHNPDMLVPRARPAGRIAALGAQRTSETRHQSDCCRSRSCGQCRGRGDPARAATPSADPLTARGIRREQGHEGHEGTKDTRTTWRPRAATRARRSAASRDLSV